ncbi:MAG: potassium-transporting ATPase subunit KdpA [Synechococcaceae cyanobacterium]|nr:potassium-transporting ATPase subunit KdpA [Synechococcaceae cyanobacterium]
MFAWVLSLLTLATVLLLVPRTGRHLFAVFAEQPQPRLDRWLLPLERPLLRWLGAETQTRTEQSCGSWSYLQPLLLDHLCFAAVAFALLALQPAWLNPLGWPGLRWDLALHTTLSFLTNTDQQHLIPERSLGNLAQLGAIQFLMYVSAASGLAVGFAVIRGISGRPLGVFRRDLVRALTRVLIPASLLLACVLLLAGVPMTLAPPLEISTLEGTRQLLPRGPIALFEAIKLLGGNGGGFVSASSAHPYENPSLFSDLLETGAMLLIPAASIDAFGRFIGNRRQSWWLLGLVFALLSLELLLAIPAEQHGNPLLGPWLAGANLQGKELRIGAGLSALWAVVTTGTMTGASNASIDALMPLSNLLTLFNLILQVVLGGQGTGIAILLVFVLLAVFLTGLMVGRTPEFLGRKLGREEVMWASFVLLVHPVLVLIPAAITLAGGAAFAGVGNPGPHGISEVVYEYASAAANNGSSMAGLANASLWWNLSASVSLLGGRYLPIAALLALAAGFRRKPALQSGRGTLRSDTALFTGFTAVVVVILGVLSFFPVLALGPIADAFLVGG